MPKTNKLLFVKRKFSAQGGAELYLKSLLHSLGRHHELHIFAERWQDTTHLIHHKATVLSLGTLSKIYSFQQAFNRFDRSSFNVTISLERLMGADIYRASDGCHYRWLQLRQEYASWIKRLSFLFNPLHRYLLDLEKRIFALTPLIIANSAMVKEEILTIAPQANVSVLHNGVDLTRFSPGPPLHNTHPKLLFVGSGFERKGLATAIKALAAMKHPTCQLFVIGKGDSKPYQQLIAHHNLQKRIHFIGTTTHIEEWYRQCDLFVLPTLYDPFSNATLEALACGLPVVTTTTNGTKEIIPFSTILSPFAPPQEWADRLEWALAHKDSLKDISSTAAAQHSITQAARAFEEKIHSFC